jgi:flagellar biosynthetic protein FliO
MRNSAGPSAIRSRVRYSRPFSGALGLLAPVCALAQTAAPAAQHPVEGPSLMPMIGALFLVLALLGAAVWVLRRTGIGPCGAGNTLRLVGQLALGPRERVVIVEVGDRWWMLGVGAGGVTRIGTLPKGEAANVESQAVASFGTLLERLRKGGS